MAFVGARLTRRVEALLDRPPRRHPSLALAVVPTVGLAIAVFAAVYADPLHHAAETALHVVLGG